MSTSAIPIDMDFNIMIYFPDLVFITHDVPDTWLNKVRATNIGYKCVIYSNQFKSYLRDENEIKQIKMLRW